jgi:hypothetical protein
MSSGLVRSDDQRGVVIECDAKIVRLWVWSIPKEFSESRSDHKADDVGDALNRRGNGNYP